MMRLSVLVPWLALAALAQDGPPVEDDPKMRGVEVVPHPPYPKGFGGTLAAVPPPKFDMRREPALEPGSMQRFGRAFGVLPPACELSADGRYVAGFVTPGHLRVWRAETLAVLFDAHAPANEADLDYGQTRPWFSPDSASLWVRWPGGWNSTAERGQLSVFDLPTGDKTSPGRFGGYTNDVDFASRDGTVGLAMNANLQMSAVHRPTKLPIGDFPRDANRGFSTSDQYRLSPSGKYLACSSYDSLTVSEAGAAAPLRSIENAESYSTSIAFRSDARLLILRPKQLDSLDVATGDVTSKPLAPSVRCLARDGRTVATYRSRRVTLLDADTLKEVGGFGLHPDEGEPNRLALDEKRKVVAVSNASRSTLYRLSDGKPVEPPGPSDPSAFAAFARRDGREWVVASPAGLGLWSAATGREEKRFAFAGERLVFAVPDATGEQIAVFSAAEGPIAMGSSARDYVVRLIRLDTLTETARLRLPGIPYVPYEMTFDASRGLGWRLKAYDKTHLVDFTADPPTVSSWMTSRNRSGDEAGPWPLPREALALPRRELYLTQVEGPPRRVQVGNNLFMVYLNRLNLAEAVPDSDPKAVAERVSFGRLAIDPDRQLALSIPTGSRYASAVGLSAFDLHAMSEIPGPGHWSADLRQPIVLPGGRLIAAVGSRSIAVVEAATGLERFRLPVKGPLPTRVFAGRDERALAARMADGTVTIWPVYPAREADPESLSGEELADAWNALAGSDGGGVHAALVLLASRPGQAVALLAEKLPRRPGPDAAALRRAVDDVLGAKPAGLDRALADLVKLGPQALPAVRGRLAAMPAWEESSRPAESARRLASAAALMRRAARPGDDAQRLRHVRCVELLGRLGTGEARELLGRLAAEAADPTLAFEASLASEASGGR